MSTDASAARPAPARWEALRRSVAWLAHPVSLVAIAVLALNDHILKDAYGTWWTGKLSDVAGLIFFPALLAVALALVAPRSRFSRLVAASLGISAVGFAVVKATSAGAEAASAAWSAVAGPSVVLRDPSDLLALAALGVAWWTAGGVAATPGDLLATRMRRAIAAVALPGAVLATAATSAPEDPGAVALVPVGDEVALAWGDLHPDGRVHTSYWSVVLPDGTVETVSVPRADEFSGALGTDGVSTLACVTELECYRPVAAGIGVEVSTDGRASWQVDWALDSAELEYLEQHLSSAATAELETTSIATVGTGSELVVVAANGADGIAVRGDDGTWTRVPTMFHTPVPLPGEPGSGDVHPVPQSLMWALTALVVLWPLCALALRRGRTWSTGALVAAGIVAFFDAAAVALVHMVNVSMEAPAWTIDGLNVAVVALVAGITVAPLTIALVAVVARTDGRAWFAGLGVATLAGAAVGALIEVLALPWWAEAALGVAVCAAAVWLLRRFAPVLPR